MAQNDYAIVVGITKYPRLADSSSDPADLQAPERDAIDVAKWLKDPNGGDVPEGNIALIYTSQFSGQPSAAMGEPQLQKVKDAFIALVSAGSKSSPSSRGDPLLGRRLYIFMSGHGFSPARYRGALYVANATRFDGLHTYASGWLEALQDGGYFKEYVLWMDCCMDREFGVPLEESVKLTTRSIQLGGTFIGFAAARPFKTVERPIKTDDNQIHGVFTWTLLEGLKGAAVDADGQITGRSLGDHLYNAVSAYLTPDDLKNPNIAKEPEIVKADRNLVFGSGRQKQSYPITLRFPLGTVGSKATLWGGMPPVAKEFTVAEEVHENLQSGLYLVTEPNLRLRHGFEVTGRQNSTLEVTTTGSQAANAGPDDTFVLTVDPHQPAAEIFLIDQTLAKLAQSRRMLTAGFPFGLYKIKIRLGQTVSDAIVLLDNDLDLSTLHLDPDGAPSALTDPTADLSIMPPLVTSAAPLLGSALSHEFHRNALEAWKAPQEASANLRAAATASNAEIRLMARVWSGQQPTLSQVRPWEEAELVDESGRTIRALTDLPMQSSEADPFVTDRLPLQPGTYFLRYRWEDGRPVECALTLPAGWIVEVFLLALASGKAGPNSPSAVRFNRMTVLMRLIGDPWRDPALEQTLESARIAMVSERRVLNKELETILMLKFQNPIAGILGGHLLLQEAERRRAGPSLRLEMLNTVIRNLRNLVGDEHPDVEALSLRCPSAALRTAKPFRQPPLFARSWELIVESSQTNPELLPLELWDRVRASMPVSGYFVWGSDARSKEGRTEQLKAWLQLAAKQMTPTETAKGAPARTSTGSGVAAQAMVALAPSSNWNDPSRMADFAKQLRVPVAAVASLLNELTNPPR